MPSRQVGSIERVRLLGGREPGILADGPWSIRVHRGTRASYIGQLTGRRTEVLNPVEVGGVIHGLDADAFGSFDDKIVWVTATKFSLGGLVPFRCTHVCELTTSKVPLRTSMPPVSGELCEQDVNSSDERGPSDSVPYDAGMHVRSFEISEVADTDLRKLHDYLVEVGGFEFRAGGTGFFVLVGERFAATTGATNAQMVLAAREDDTINVDVIAAGGGVNDNGQQLAAAQRATELLRGFADRTNVEIVDV